MKTTTRTNDISGQWKQAVCGSREARARLLQTIMPKSAYRPR